MMVLVLRSREIPGRVSPKTMVSPTKRVEMSCEPLFAVFSGNLLLLQQPSGTSLSSCGCSAFASIDFSLLKRRLHFFIHASTLLNLLPNCLCNLRRHCPKWFFGLHCRVLILVSQRSHQGVTSPSPKLACP